ncbi:MAG: zinc ribbon domain-containing protein, partial [Chloroflexota bacterium]
MYCIRCGKKNVPDALFCYNCGTQLLQGAEDSEKAVPPDSAGDRTTAEESPAVTLPERPLPSQPSPNWPGHRPPSGGPVWPATPPSYT